MAVRHSQRRGGAVLGYVNILVKNIVNLAYTPMLLAFIGQGDYGVFEMANSTVYSLSLLSFGFSGAYVRFYMQRKEKGDEKGIRRLNGMYFLLYAAISAVALIAGLVLSASSNSLFAASLTESELELFGRLLVVMAVNISVTLFSTVFDGFIIVRERFVFQQSRQILTTLATPFLSLFLLTAGMGAIGAACAQLTVNIILLALNARYSLHTLGVKFAFRERERGLLRTLAIFSGWVFLNQVCDLVNQNVPNIVLGALSGSSAVAVFAIAVKIRSIFISLSTTLSNLFVPEVNRIVASSDDNAVLTRLMTRVGRLQSMLLWWVYFGFLLLGRWFVGVWAGSDYSSAYYLVLAMTAPLIIPLSQNVGIEIQRAKNMHRARSIVYALIALMSVAVTAVFASKFGYWAAAIAYIGSIAVGNCIWMNWYYSVRVGLDMGFYWKRVIPVVGCAALSGFACLAGVAFFPVTGVATFLIWGTVYTIAYAALIWLVALSADERTMVFKRLGERNG